MNKKFFWCTPVILFSILHVPFSAADSDGAQIVEDNSVSQLKLDPVVQARFRKRVGNRNISAALLNLADEYIASSAQGGAGAFKSSISGLQAFDGFVTIDAAATSSVQDLKSDLASLGAEHISSYGSMVSARLPISAVHSLDQLSSLMLVRPFYATTNVGAVTSLGDEAQRSDEARLTYSLTGAGIKVGVLSDSYDCLGGAAADVATGDLPSGVTVLEELGGCGGGSDEGRGMAQLIFDVAPGSELSFNSAFNGVAGFAAGIGALVTDGADVVVDDIIYFAEPMFQDGPVAQAADAAAAAGVPYFSAAGNSDVASYESQFVDSGLSGPNFGVLHDFDPSANVDVFQTVSVPVGGSFFLTLQWNQPYASVSGLPGATSDLDVFVAGQDGTLLAGSFDNNLSGDPVEVFQFVNSGFDLDGVAGLDTQFAVIIEIFDGADPDLIKYTLNGSGSISEYDTQSGTAYGHANARNAAGVGAAFFYDTPEFGTDPAALEGFSSRGDVPIYFETNGTPIFPPERRLTPSITAPDGGNTTFFGQLTGVNIPAIGEPDEFYNFFGTSAAAPHAAGVAALLLESNSLLTAHQVYRALENSTSEMSTPGYDIDSGFGLIRADDAVALLANDVPTLDPIPSVELTTVGGATVISLNAVDPDTDGIAFSVTDLPAFCVDPITDNGNGTGSITCTAADTDIGRFSVTVTATDDGAPARSHSQGFYIFSNINGAPVLDDVLPELVDEGGQAVFNFDATDPNGDTLTYSITEGVPPFCIFSVSTLTCNPGFTDEGLWVTRVFAADDGVPQMGDSQPVEIEVSNVNRPPVLAAIGARNVDEDGNTSIGLSATDPDPDTMSFGVAGIPVFCSLNNTGNGTATLDCAPTFADAGGYDLTITVDDNSDNNGTPDNLTDSEAIVLTVNDVNRPPAIVAIGDQSTSVGQILVIDISSSDGDGNALALSETGLPGFCALTDNTGGTGDVTCTPTLQGHIGLYPTTITVTDNGTPNLNAATSFNINIIDVNQAPVIQQIGSAQPLLIDSTTIIPISSSDADGNVLSLSLTDSTGFCSIADNGDGTGSVGCSPGISDSGTFSLTVTVTDDGAPNLNDATTFDVSVTDRLNAPPVLALIGNRAGEEGAPFNIPLSAADDIANTLAFAQVGLPAFCGLTNNGDKTASIACNPVGGDDGTYPVTVSVTDDGTPWVTGSNTPFLDDSESFNIVVSLAGTANSAPVLAPIGNKTETEGSILVIPLSASDADGGDILTFGETGLPAFCILTDAGDGNGDITCSPDVLIDEGNYPVTVTVMDNGAPVLSDSEAFNIEILHLDQLPNANAGSDSVVETGFSVILDGSASSDLEGPVTFSWRLTGVGVGSALTNSSIVNAATSTPSFTPDVDGTFVVELTVTDNIGQTQSDSASIIADSPKLLYVINKGDGTFADLVEIDPFDGSAIGSIPITMPGRTVIGGTALAVDPATNIMYASLKLQGQQGRELAIMDPATAVATSIGDMGDNVAGFAFDGAGTLYAVTGDGATVASTLFTVNTNTGALTLVQALGNGTDGEAIAYNPDDGLMYHFSGVAPMVFETIDLNTGTVTNIPLSGGVLPDAEVFGFEYDPLNGLFVVTIGDYDAGLPVFGTVTPSGFLTIDANMLFIGRGVSWWDSNFKPVTQSMVLRRSTDSRWFAYELDGSDIIEKGKVELTRSPDYSVVSRGDFNADGKPDLLLRDLVGGQNGRWVMAVLDGPGIVAEGFADLTRNDVWGIVAIEDFDGDNKSDVLLRNSADGRWLLYLMDSTTIVGQGQIPLSTDLTDTYQGTGDFNGDGRQDVLLRRADGTWVIYALDGLGTVTELNPAITSNALFTLQAIADRNGDGIDDILLRRNDGRWFLYTLFGETILDSGAPAMSENTAFTHVASADFNGDGNIDVLLRRNDGRWFMYLLNGRTILGSGSVDMTTNTAFQLVSSRDYDNDGNSDALLRRADGRWALYSLDGLTILSVGIPDMTRNTSWTAYPH